MSVLAQLKLASPLGTLLGKMYAQISTKYEANAVYKELRPLLGDLLLHGYSFDSPQVQSIVNVLRELPAYGAQRRNFERLYLKDDYTLRELPEDPDMIPGGHWH